MQHIRKASLLASALVLKGEEEDPGAIVTKALDDLTKTVDERFKALEAKGLDPKLDERLKALETKAKRPGGDQKTVDEAAAFERKAFGNYLRYGTAGMPAEELKVLQVSNDQAGGYLAPKEVASEIIKDLVLISPVRSVASVRSTSSPSVVYPKRTGLTNAKWKGETQAQEGSEPTFGQAEIIVKELNTYVDISNQLLADSAGQAEAEVRLALADDFAQKEGRAFVSGNGVLEPEGIMTNGDITSIPNTNTGTLVPDALVALMYSLPAIYRNQATWGMNGTTLGKLRLLKDGQNNFLWQPSFRRASRRRSLAAR